MTHYTGSPELLFVRNVHTNRRPGKVGFEHAPPSADGMRESKEVAAYLKTIMGERGVMLFTSPLTSRSMMTAHSVMAELDEEYLSIPPEAHQLYIDPDERARIDASMDPESVAIAELKAMRSLWHDLEAFHRHLDDPLSVVIMSGLAILRYFAGQGTYSREDVDRIIPTGAVIHINARTLTGPALKGHKVDPLTKYLATRNIKHADA